VYTNVVASDPAKVFRYRSVWVVVVVVVVVVIIIAVFSVYCTVTRVRGRPNRIDAVARRADIGNPRAGAPSDVIGADDF